MFKCVRPLRNIIATFALNDHTHSSKSQGNQTKIGRRNVIGKIILYVRARSDSYANQVSVHIHIYVLLALTEGALREPVKNYLADFFR